jgi:hypothetical protein
MSDNLVDKIRAALINNQGEAVRFVTERDERIAELEAEVALLKHRVRCLALEVSCRSAANEHLRNILETLELELRAQAEPGPAQDRLNEDGERTFAPNLPELEDN